MNVRLFPLAAAGAVVLAVSTARAAFLEFDINALTVKTVDGNNNPIVPADANFSGTFVISKNSGTFINAVLYNSVAHAPITLVDISGFYTVDNGFSDGGSLSLTFANPDSSQTTYTYTIPVDTVRSPSDKSILESFNPTRFLANWDTAGSLLSSPKVSDMTFPNPLGLGYFTQHDFKPSTVAGPGFGSDGNVNLDIAVDVPVTVPEPASLVMLLVTVPVLLNRRRRS